MSGQPPKHALPCRAPGLLAGYGSADDDDLGAHEASDAELDAQVAQFAVALSREGLLPPEEVPAALLARVPTAVEKPDGALDEEVARATALAERAAEAAGDQLETLPLVRRGVCLWDRACVRAHCTVPCEQRCGSNGSHSPFQQACRVAVEAQTLSALLSIFATRGPGLDWAFARLVLVQALQESAAQLETALQRADKQVCAESPAVSLPNEAAESAAGRRTPEPTADAVSAAPQPPLPPEPSPPLPDEPSSEPMDVHLEGRPAPNAQQGEAPARVPTCEQIQKHASRWSTRYESVQPHTHTILFT